MPQRIQRKRTAGYRLPDGAVCVDRTTKWGNPFTVGGPIAPDFAGLIANVTWNGLPLTRSGAGVVEDRRHAVELFEFWLYAKVPFTQAQMTAALHGRDLACWCPLPASGETDWCHARVLLESANQ
jgi:hypothetical protein